MNQKNSRRGSETQSRPKISGSSSFAPRGAFPERFSSLCLCASAAVLLLGCGQEAPPTAGLAPPQAGPPTIALTAVVSQTLAKSMRLPGELLPRRDVAVYARVPGFVEKIDVDRGAV